MLSITTVFQCVKEINVLSIDLSIQHACMPSYAMQSLANLAENESKIIVPLLTNTTGKMFQAKQKSRIKLLPSIFVKHCIVSVSLSSCLFKASISLSLS